MLYKKKWTLKHFGKIKENKVGTQVGYFPGNKSNIKK